MFRFGNGVRGWLCAAGAAALLALVIVRLVFGGVSAETARDFEECADLAQAKHASSGELKELMTGCGARFAGRRKAGGGYTYYDFMQDRQFDIAGPNPTAEERTIIDREYITYLEERRREAISAALTKRQNDLLRADMESARQPAGPPLSLLPANVPLPVPRRVAEQRERARQCAEDAVFCTLSKFSTAVKDAFASSPKTKN
ncbi:MAG TPA: hypothetical protein VKT76_08930 [Bradyrhizobium sp.]|nr:hypothetical protein [Bradyrhizobium sp.]